MKDTKKTKEQLIAELVESEKNTAPYSKTPAQQL